MLIFSYLRTWTKVSVTVQDIHKHAKTFLMHQNLNSLVFKFCFFWGGHTSWCSGLFPGIVFRYHSWCVEVRGPNCVPGNESAQLHAKQVPDHLYYSSQPQYSGFKRTAMEPRVPSTVSKRTSSKNKRNQWKDTLKQSGQRKSKFWKLRGNEQSKILRHGREEF